MTTIAKTSLLIRADHTCDYIPFISTASNLTDLFQKCVVIPSSNRETVKNNHYYTHLRQKSFLRCITLLIPVIGNVVVGLIDLASIACQDKSFMIAAIGRLGSFAFGFASEELQEDKDVTLALMKQDGLMLKYVRENFQNDPDIVLASVEQNGLALQYASRELRSNDKVALAAVNQRDKHLLDSSKLKQVFYWVDETLKDNPDFMLATLRHLSNKWYELQFVSEKIAFASDRLKENREFMLSAVQKNRFAILAARKQILKDKEIVLAALQDSNNAKPDSLERTGSLVSPVKVSKTDPLGSKYDWFGSLLDCNLANWISESISDELKKDKDIIIALNQKKIEFLESDDTRKNFSLYSSYLLPQYN